MKTILITRTAYRRLQPHLGALVGLTCLVLDEEGVIRREDVEVCEGEVAADCSWVSHDFFVTPVGPHLFATLQRLTGLDWVQSSGAGTDHPMFPMLAEKGVRLSTNHGQADGMAEYVMWGVLDHYQGGRMRAVDQAGRFWSKRRWREIGGTRWLILGFGAIGEAVARRAKGFGIHVTGARRNAQPSDFADAIITPDKVRERLGESDVVLLCLPRTPATDKMVNADFLAAMKPGSMLINVGRGSVVDEAALLAALDAGKPAHALLDVFRVEPLAPESRFWDHPRVTVTTHSSALSESNEERTDAAFLENLARYVAGDEPLHQLTPAQVLANQP